MALFEVLAAGVAFVAILAYTGVAYQRLGAAADGKRYPPPGKMVNVGGHRLHILSQGKGEPTVVFEAGLPGSVLSWSLVMPELSRLVRVAAYDRAGLGWSDPGPEPRTAARIVEELRKLLDRAGISPPYILVGHSFGGLTTRLFAARYPDEVAGLVLVDPVGPGEWIPVRERERRRLGAGARLCRRTAWLARFGVARLVALLVRLGAYGLTRFAVLFMSSGLLRDAGRTVGPLQKLPAEQRPIVTTFWVQPKFYEAMASQIEAMTESAEQVLAEGDRLKDKPVIVISASNAEPARLAEQIAIAGLSSRGRHVMAPRCGHWIQLEDPELVSGAILEVLADLGHVPASPGERGNRRVIH